METVNLFGQGLSRFEKDQEAGENTHRVFRTYIPRAGDGVIDVFTTTSKDIDNGLGEYSLAAQQEIFYFLMTMFEKKKVASLLVRLRSDDGAPATLATLARKSDGRLNEEIHLSRAYKK